MEFGVLDFCSSGHRFFNILLCNYLFSKGLNFLWHRRNRFTSLVDMLFSHLGLFRLYVIDLSNLNSRLPFQTCLLNWSLFNGSCIRLLDLSISLLFRLLLNSLLLFLRFGFSV